MGSQDSSVSPLRVLWVYSFKQVLDLKPDLVQNLVSLDLIQKISSRQLRTFLVGSAGTIKHLGVKVTYWEEEKEITGEEEEEEEEDENEKPRPEALALPNLEVLDLKGGDDLPEWMILPSDIKLINPDLENFLPSVSELWIESLGFRDELPNLQTRCPTIKCLGFRRSEFHKGEVSYLLSVIEERHQNIEAGLQFDGVPIEKIRKLVIPSQSFCVRDLGNFKRDGTGSSRHRNSTSFHRSRGLVFSSNS